MNRYAISKQFFLMIICLTLLVTGKGIASGQPIVPCSPSQISLPGDEPAYVRLTLTLGEVPENFVLSVDEYSLYLNYPVYILDCRVLSNTEILLRFGPNVSLGVLNHYPLIFRTSAGIVRLRVDQRLSARLNVPIRCASTRSGAAYFTPGREVRIEQSLSPSRQFYWMHKVGDGDWVRLNNTGNINELRQKIYTRTQFQQVTTNSSETFHSNVVHYFPVTEEVLRNLEISTSSDTLFQGKSQQISVYPVLGADVTASYSWQFKQDGEQNWKTLTGKSTEKLEITDEISGSGLLRRVTLCLGKTWYSNELRLYYKDFTQNRITSSRSVVSHYMPFHLIPEEYTYGSTAATYSWERKKRTGGTWTVISGSTAEDLKNYTDVTEDTYFRRVVRLSGKICYSNEVLIRYAEIQGGEIGCSERITIPGGSVRIHSVVPQNGNAGCYVWEKKIKGRNVWTVISGQTGEECSGTVSAGGTLFRRKITLGSKVWYSNEILVVGDSVPVRITCSYTDTTGMNYITDLDYYDGFTRQSQQIGLYASPGGRADIITPFYQPVHAAPEREYLPFSQPDNTGSRSSSPFLFSNWTCFETADRPYAFTKVVRDNSALNRELQRVGPGKSWHEAGKGKNTVYGTNGDNEVKFYRIGSNYELVASGTYPKGSLQKILFTDEDGKQQVIFQDSEGKTIGEILLNGTVQHVTRYIYNLKGQLCYVLSPEAGAASSLTAGVLNEYAYSYQYDDWGRQIVKRLPGCAPQYFVYDRKDRPVLSQDGNQRSADKWSYSLYDNRNRMVETGEVVLSGKTHTQLQTQAGSSDNYIPSASRTAYQYLCYDNYNNRPVLVDKPFVADSGYSGVYSRLTSGLLTGLKTRIVGSDTWLTTSIYYDSNNREIQRVSDNSFGRLSRISSGYDFFGNVVQVRESHVNSSGVTDVAETVNVYDNRSRLLTTETTLRDKTSRVVYSYDAPGRLTGKTYGSGGSAVIETLSYNLRGWLTGKSSSKFSMQLRYQSPTNLSSPCYNGNISEWEWDHPGKGVLMYGFAYDGLNRLLSSFYYTQSGSTWLNTDSYTEKGITYDRNGNLRTLTRTGGSSTKTLVYSYSGNRLTGLSGDGNRSYSYDLNGNLKNDSYRGRNLTYNFLNLLSSINGNALTYRWLADGTKLGVSSGSDGYDYVGSLIYKRSNGVRQLEGCDFGEGRILTSGSGCEIYYFLRDHLGSVRSIVNAQTGGVVECNDYYPFGGCHERSDYAVSSNRYRYNGKELQTTGGLGYLDYGARMYDPELGRWFGMDPMAEERYAQSSYGYCGNSPVILVDPDGCLETHYVDKDYNTIFQTNDGSDDVVMLPESYVPVFRFYNRIYSSASVFNSPGWNAYWKQEFGLASRQLSIAELNVLSRFNSRWSRDNAVSYLLNPTPFNSMWMGISEGLSSWTNPELLAAGASMGIVGWQGMGGRAVEGGFQLKSSVTKVMGNPYKTMGEVTVPIKNTELLNFLNSTSKGNWVKVYEAGIQNGAKIETHYFRNNTTGQVFDVKTKYNYWHQKAFKTIEQ